MHATGPIAIAKNSGREHRKSNSPRLVKRETGFPNPQLALIGSNQLWLTTLPRILRCLWQMNILSRNTSACQKIWYQDSSLKMAFRMTCPVVTMRIYSDPVLMSQQWCMYMNVGIWCAVTSRDHSGYGLSQWKETLHSKVSFHWLSPYPEWSLTSIN